MDRNRRRKFGQNFLIDADILDEIAKDIVCRANVPIVEIGPGRGALTRRLMQISSHVTAIEIDPQLVGYLKDRPAFRRLRLISGDAVKCPLSEILENPSIPKEKPVLVGNLPYNKAGPILRRFVPLLAHFQYMYIMVQYEVAKRLTATPNSRDFAFLSVFIQTYADVELVRIIQPQAFRPRPKVKSATVRLSPLASPAGVSPGYFSFLKLSFSQKRKKIINSLGIRFDKKLVARALVQCGIPADSRSEQISPENFEKLYAILEKHIRERLIKP